MELGNHYLSAFSLTWTVCVCVCVCVCVRDVLNELMSGELCSLYNRNPAKLAAV